jgi:hypothetical protein
MPTTQAFEYPRKHLPSPVHFVGPLLPLPPRATCCRRGGLSFRSTQWSTSPRARSPPTPPP